jgi:ATP-binding cassette, subfamily B, bacterial
VIPELNTRNTGVLRLCRWLVRYAVRRWPALLAVLATLLLKAGFQVLTPWPMKVLVDHVLDEKPMPAALARGLVLLPGAGTRETLLAWSVAATVVLFILAWALGLASAYTNIGFGRRMVYDLAADLFGHLKRLSLRYHSRKSVGDSIRRITTDCGCVSTIVADALIPVLGSLFSLVLMFTIMWRLDATLTLLSLTVVPFMVATFQLYAGPMLARNYAEQALDGRLYNVVEETLAAIPVVHAFGGEERVDRRFQASTRALLAATLATMRVELGFKILMATATAAGTAGILWIGTRHALDGQLTVGGILVFLSYLGSLYGPLNSLMYTSSTIQGAAGSARRVLEVLEADREVKDRPGAGPLPPARGHVRFDNVIFGYEPDRPVLRGISLEVPPGQTVAIVGPTGAGKSTLVSLVPRFFDPWAGRVTVDGRDVRDVHVKSLRAQVALVLQESFLFPLTIAENIAYGRPHASRAEIEAAARAANAHAFIEQLPAGYDTLVGERGATLSGGERQRLSIARALLKDAPILILDEPTSALDAETESLLLEALRRLMHGRTTLIIAHRLSTIRGADWIVVLRDGMVTEAGTHQDLLAQSGSYHRVHELQFGRVAAGMAPDAPAGNEPP